MPQASSIFPGNFLFVYGTLLLPEQQEPARYLQRQSQDLGPGHFPGFLYDLGDFPGAQWEPEAPGRVYGRIHRLLNPIATLKFLDDYEGCGAADPRPHLFVRRRVPVQQAEESFSCWVYLYNHDPARLPLIAGGDYLVYRQQS